MSDELLELGRQDIILLADRCEAAEAEVARLTRALDEIAYWNLHHATLGYEGPSGLARAALTPYNEGDQKS